MYIDVGRCGGSDQSRAGMQLKRGFLPLVVLLASVLQDGVGADRAFRVDDVFNSIFRVTRGFAKIYPAAAQQIKDFLNVTLGDDAPRYIQPVLDALKDTADDGDCNRCKVGCSHAITCRCI